ncbi:MAG TPA: HAMP domain-containing sensor histidine kinase [Rectinemataceae bacterium]|nr:HAMP domain-containing sensor histidine kinase [Rectinemataceae bacterium]
MSGSDAPFPGRGRTARRRSPRLVFSLGGLGVSAFFLPLALFSILRLVITWGTASPSDALTRFIRSAHEVRLAVGLDATGKLAPRTGYRPPSWLDLVVADREGLVIYSTMPELESGRPIAPAEVARIAARLVPERSFVAESLAMNGRVEGVYYAIMTGAPLGFTVDPALPLIIAASFMGMAVLAFLVGSLTAGRIAAEVLRLQRAADRIAQGDLETAVEAKGVREIADLAAAMDLMRRSLREDLARRYRFLAAVSHDLRTPLTSIGGYLEAVEDGLAADPDTLRRYVAIMRDKARLLETRISELIDFARIETEEWRLRFEELDLHALLRELAGQFHEDAALLGRRFEARLDACTALHVRADRVLTMRAMENVVSNALQYTPEGGLVSIKAEAKPGVLELWIEDEGPGFRNDEIEKVFEPFYRGSQARAGEGSGLGLYIARSIVRGQGWDIRADPSGKGGRVAFVIPLPGGREGVGHERN